MKLLIVSASLLAGLLAQAQSSYEVLSSRRMFLLGDIVTTIHYGPKVLFDDAGVTGSILIDKRLKQVYLNLGVRDSVDDTFTHIVAQSQLSLIEVTTNACNAVIYRATLEDASKQEELIITDYSKVDDGRTECAISPVMEKTTLVYNVKKEAVTYEVRMWAKPLQKDFTSNIILQN